MEQREPAEKPATGDHASDKYESRGETVKQLGEKVSIKNLIVAALILKHISENAAHPFHVRAG